MYFFGICFILHVIKESVEYIDLLFRTCCSGKVRIIVVYRQPNSEYQQVPISTFIGEFSDFIYTTLSY